LENAEGEGATVTPSEDFPVEDKRAGKVRKGEQDFREGGGGFLKAPGEEPDLAVGDVGLGADTVILVLDEPLGGICEFGRSVEGFSEHEIEGMEQDGFDRVERTVAGGASDAGEIPGAIVGGADLFDRDGSSEGERLFHHFLLEADAKVSGDGLEKVFDR